MRELCDDCIAKFLYNMSRDEMVILDYLYKVQAVNPLLGIEKNKIIENIADMTDFKFTVATSALEARLMIGTGKSKKPLRYFLTGDGEAALRLFSEIVEFQQKQLEKLNMKEGE